MATDNLYMAGTDHQHRSFSQVLVKKKADSVKNQPWTYRVFEESHPNAAPLIGLFRRSFKQRLYFKQHALFKGAPNRFTMSFL